MLVSPIAALAADMPVKAPVFTPVPVYNWTGLYVGLNAGVGFGRANANTDPAFSPTGYFAATSTPAISTAGNQSMNRAGFTGGLQLGYNWQMNNAVLGLEADFGYMGMRASSSASALYPCCAPTGFTVSSTAKTDWLMTLRPRLGIANNNWLFYLTGGLAVGQVKGDFNFTDTFATAAESASISKTKAGWVLGGGVEYGMAGPWSLKLEYLHVDLGSVSGTSANLTAFGPPAIAFPTNVFTHSVKVTNDIVRVGFNYKL
jgi:outer membrane immunogenic protein